MAPRGQLICIHHASSTPVANRRLPGGANKGDLVRPAARYIRSERNGRQDAGVLDRSMTPRGSVTGQTRGSRSAGRGAAAATGTIWRADVIDRVPYSFLPHRLPAVPESCSSPGDGKSQCLRDAPRQTGLSEERGGGSGTSAMDSALR